MVDNLLLHYIPASMGLWTIGALILCFYPITHRRHEENLDILRAREAEALAREAGEPPARRPVAVKHGIDARRCRTASSNHEYRTRRQRARGEHRWRPWPNRRRARTRSTISAAEVRDFLAANFPPSLKGKGNALASVEGPTSETAEMTAWREAMGEKGWGVPTWPKEYGGGGLEQGASARAGRRNGAGRRVEPDRRDGRDDVRPDLARIWLRSAEARAYPGDRQGRDPLVPGLFRTQRRVRPRQPPDLRRG